METAKQTTAAEKSAALMLELAQVLGCKVKYVGVRLGALNLLVTCSRCGGSGRYSYNQITGDTCFKCQGAGKQLPKITGRLIATVREMVAAGALAPYLEAVAKRAAAKAAIKPLMAAIDSEWKEGAVHVFHNRYYLARLNEYGFLISDLASEINDHWQVAKDAEFQVTGKMEATEAVAIIERSLAEIRRLNAAAAEMGYEGVMGKVQTCSRWDH